jgi:hypothetical protein
VPPRRCGPPGFRAGAAQIAHTAGGRVIGVARSSTTAVYLETRPERDWAVNRFVIVIRPGPTDARHPSMQRPMRTPCCPRQNSLSRNNVGPIQSAESTYAAVRRELLLAALRNGRQR